MRIRSLTFIVNDIARAQVFYEKLGFKVLAGDIERVVLRTDEENQQLVLLKESKSRKLAGHGMGAFYKENVPGFFQKCKIMGAAFEKDLTETAEGNTFAFRDPDGNGLEIFEMVESVTAGIDDQDPGKDLPQEENVSQELESREKVGEPENEPGSDSESENEDDEPAFNESPRGLGDFQPYIEDKVN